MNKIIAIEDKIEEVIEKNNVIEVTKDSIIHLDRLLNDENLCIKIDPYVKCTIYLKSDTTKNNIYYYIKNHAHVEVNHFAVDCQDKVEIYLQEESAQIDYNYRTINKNENTFTISVFHQEKNTISNVSTHGVNIYSNPLIFDVNATIEQNSNDCVCNQDNRIIHLQDAKCEIKPNLWVDNHQVEANHAAYIGTFDQEQIFYLMSRGIEEKKCYRLLLEGFLLQGQKIDEEIKSWLLKQLEK